MSNTYKCPPICPMTKEESVNKIKEIARAYTPEWYFTPEDLDAGGAIALIYSQMFKESMDHINEALYKHHVGFLNCLDIQLKEARPAQSYVTFEVVPTFDTGIFIPKNTYAMGRTGDGEDVLFATCHSLYATNKAPTDMIIISKEQGKIVSIYEKGEALSKLEIELFDFSGENKQDHRFFIAHPFICKGDKQTHLQIDIQSYEGKAREEWINKEKIGWVYLTEEGFKKIEAIDLKEEKIHIFIEEPLTLQTYEGKEGYWIGAFAKNKADLPYLTTHKIVLNNERKHLEPEVIYASEREQVHNCFKPFGEPLEIYSECYIKCEEAFTKTGAQLTLKFNLEYSIRENDLPELEEEINFKYVMKKPKKKYEISKPEIRVDEVSWEYWNGKGWIKVSHEVSIQHIFNGVQKGEMEIKFTCPQNIEAITINGYEAKWIRIRAIKIDSIYSIPSKEIIPVIKNMSIHYTYKESHLKPSYVYIENNRCVEDVTYLINNDRSTLLLRDISFEEPALFIGFEELPEQSPLSLFFNIVNNTVEEMPPLKFEYSSLKDEEILFRTLSVSDGTNNFKTSGNLIIVFPKMIAKVTLFSKERYWIKITDYSKIYDTKVRIRPKLKGIYMNTARVINEIQKEENHYIKQSSEEVKVQLQGNNITSLEVYINEKPTDKRVVKELIEEPMYQTRLTKDKLGNIESCYIKWMQVENKTNLKLDRRNYYFDALEKKLIFPRNCFITFPAETKDTAIRVSYKMCNGNKGNVDKESIVTLQSPIPFINRIYNPIPAFGSSAFETIEEALVRAAKYVQHRNFAVTLEDYEILIKDYSSSIKKVKCLADSTPMGKKEQGAISVAVLTDDYDKGNHTFLSYYEHLKQYIEERSDLKLLNKKLYLQQPFFIALDTQIWIETNDMEKAYEYQQLISDKVNRFIDPIKGYFDEKGWRIGNLPKKNQVEAYLKSLELGCTIKNIILTAKLITPKGEVEKELEYIEKIPFALAIKGIHTVLVDLK